MQQKVNASNVQLLQQTQLNVEQVLQLFENLMTQYISTSTVNEALQMPFSPNNFVLMNELSAGLNKLQPYELGILEDDIMRLSDLMNWTHDDILLALGQQEWAWARGRITAGFVLDCRQVQGIGKFLMFFHGSGPEDERSIFDTHACIGFAWSDDLLKWSEWAIGDFKRSSQLALAGDRFA